jgi:hypothetical protein
MIQASIVNPQNPDSIAVAVASATFPVRVFYSLDALNEEQTYEPAATLTAPGTAEISDLIPGAWYRLVLLDASMDQAVSFLAQVPSGVQFSIDILRESIKASNVIAGRSTCFRLRITAANPVGLPDAGVFLYWNPGAAAAPLFQAVCKPNALEEYFLDGTDVGPIRKTYVDIIEMNRDLLEEDWAIILSDVNSLMENLNRNYSLDRDLFVRVDGTLPTDPLTEVP